MHPEEVGLLVGEARAHVELGEGFEPPRELGLFGELAQRGLLGRFARFDQARGDFQGACPDGRPVLLDEEHAALRVLHEERHRVLVLDDLPVFVFDRQGKDLPAVEVTSHEPQYRR